MASGTSTNSATNDVGLLETLYNNPEYSDLTIKSADRDFHVHKNIICTQSKYFANACKSEWQKSKDKAVVNLNEESGEVVEKIIHFFYLSPYSTTPYEAPKQHKEPITFALSMVLAADKYDIPALLQITLSKLRSEVDAFSCNYSDFLKAFSQVHEGVPSCAADLQTKMFQIVMSRTEFLFNETPKTEWEKQVVSDFQKFLSKYPSTATKIDKAVVSAYNKFKQQVKSQFECRGCDINITIDKVLTYGASCPLCKRYMFQKFAA